MRNAHVIEDLRFEVAYAGEVQAFEQQSRLAEFVRGPALAIIDEVFDEASPADQVLRIERLALDLGRVNGPDLEHEWSRRLRDQLRDALQGLRVAGRADPDGEAGTPAGARTHSAGQARQQVWMHYLQRGHLPWHAGGIGPNDVEALADAVLRDRDPDLAAALRSAPRRDVLVRRLASHLDAARVAHLVETLAPGHAELPRTLLALSDLAAGPAPAEADRVQLRARVSEAVLERLLMPEGVSARMLARVQALLAAVARALDLPVAGSAATLPRDPPRRPGQAASLSAGPSHVANGAPGESPGRTASTAAGPAFSDPGPRAQRSQENAGPPQVSLLPAGGGPGAARTWGRSQVPDASNWLVAPSGHGLRGLVSTPGPLGPPPRETTRRQHGNAAPALARALARGFALAQAATQRRASNEPVPAVVQAPPPAAAAATSPEGRRGEAGAAMQASTIPLAPIAHAAVPRPAAPTVTALAHQAMAATPSPVVAPDRSALSMGATRIDTVGDMRPARRSAQGATLDTRAPGHLPASTPGRLADASAAAPHTHPGVDADARAPSMRTGAPAATLGGVAPRAGAKISSEVVDGDASPPARPRVTPTAPVLSTSPRAPSSGDGPGPAHPDTASAAPHASPARPALALSPAQTPAAALRRPVGPAMNAAGIGGGAADDPAEGRSATLVPIVTDALRATLTSAAALARAAQVVGASRTQRPLSSGLRSHLRTVEAARPRDHNRPLLSLAQPHPTGTTPRPPGIDLSSTSVAPGRADARSAAPPRAQAGHTPALRRQRTVRAGTLPAPPAMLRARSRTALEPRAVQGPSTPPGSLGGVTHESPTLPPDAFPGRRDAPNSLAAMTTASGARPRETVRAATAIESPSGPTPSARTATSPPSTASAPLPAPAAHAARHAEIGSRPVRVVPHTSEPHHAPDVAPATEEARDTPAGLARVARASLGRQAPEPEAQQAPWFISGGGSSEPRPSTSKPLRSRQRASRSPVSAAIDARLRRDIVAARSSRPQPRAETGGGVGAPVRARALPGSAGRHSPAGSPPVNPKGRGRGADVWRFLAGLTRTTTFEASLRAPELPGSRTQVQRGARPGGDSPAPAAPWQGSTGPLSEPDLPRRPQRLEPTGHGLADVSPWVSSTRPAPSGPSVRTPGLPGSRPQPLSGTGLGEITPVPAPTSPGLIGPAALSGLSNRQPASASGLAVTGEALSLASSKPASVSDTSARAHGLPAPSGTEVAPSVDGIGSAAQSLPPAGDRAPAEWPAGTVPRAPALPARPWQAPASSRDENPGASANPPATLLQALQAVAASDPASASERPVRGQDLPAPAATEVAPSVDGIGGTAESQPADYDRAPAEVPADTVARAPAFSARPWPAPRSSRDENLGAVAGPLATLLQALQAVATSDPASVSEASVPEPDLAASASTEVAPSVGGMGSTAESPSAADARADAEAHADTLASAPALSARTRPATASSRHTSLDAVASPLARLLQALQAVAASDPASVSEASVPEPDLAASPSTEVAPSVGGMGSTAESPDARADAAAHADTLAGAPALSAPPRPVTASSRHASLDAVARPLALLLQALYTVAASRRPSQRSALRAGRGSSRHGARRVQGSLASTLLWRSVADGVPLPPRPQRAARWLEQRLRDRLGGSAIAAALDRVPTLRGTAAARAVPRVPPAAAQTPRAAGGGPTSGRASADGHDAGGFDRQPTQASRTEAAALARRAAPTLTRGMADRGVPHQAGVHRAPSGAAPAFPPSAGSEALAAPVVRQLVERLDACERRDLLALLSPSDHEARAVAVDLLLAACRGTGLGVPVARLEHLAWCSVLQRRLDDSQAFDAGVIALQLFDDLVRALDAPEPTRWRAALAEQLLQLGTRETGPRSGSTPSAASLARSMAAALGAPAARPSGEPEEQGPAQRPPSTGRPMTPPREASSDPWAFDANEAIHLANAGLVLVAPYLPRLFDTLGLTAERRFTAPAAAERAAQLLQFVVDGTVDAPEPALVLNKILCGVPLEAVLPREWVVNPQEQAAVEGLLQAVIAHWKIIGKTSVAGLRESFLQREGRLTQRDEAWHLQVAPRAFDMLLDQLPWSFATLKFPWMERIVHVDWR